MIKKLVLLFVIAILLFSCTPKNNYLSGEYSIEVSLDTLIEGPIYLSKRVNNKNVHIDTSEMLDGKYSFKGYTNFPERYFVQITNPKILIPFFVEASEIKININTKDINKSSIVGSVSNNEYEAYLDQLEIIDNKLRVLTQEKIKAKNEGDDAKYVETDNQIAQIYKDKDVYTFDYILSNNTLTSTPYIAYKNLYNWSLEQMKVIVDTLATDLDNSVYKKHLDIRIAILERVSLGKPYIPFTMTNTEGNDVSLADLIQDNYLLIDFWASWCSPCRAENPNLVSCYNDFHDKGFDILGVSLDKDGGKWKKAIEDDMLNWYQVSDLNGWANKAGQLYGVISIPSNILLDPNGIIIGRNLRGERLRKKLEDIFN
ncbi:thioredoxin-like domain-containing protein [Bacteroidota bacterium]